MSEVIWPIDLKRLMLTRFCYTFAVSMQAILLGWQMYTLTKDPLFLGLIGLTEAIPAISLALFSGYIVDRHRPLFIYRHVYFLSIVSSVLMIFCSQEINSFEKSSQIILLFISAFLTGLCRSFVQPIMFTTVPKLVPKNLLGKSSALMTTTLQVARILGPALAGLMFAYAGLMKSAIFVTSILLAGLFFLEKIQIKIINTAPENQNISFMEEFLSGAKFVFKHPILLPALTLDMVSVLFGGVTALLPIYADEVLHVGATGVGILRSSVAFGAAIVSIWLTNKNINAHAGKYLFLGVTGFGISILVFALSQNFYLSLVALILSGGFDSISMVVRTTAVQLFSPEKLRGKISAVNSIFIGSSNELGEFESGIAAKALGLVPAAFMGGVVCLFTVIFVYFRYPKLRKLNFDHHH